MKKLFGLFFILFMTVGAMPAQASESTLRIPSLGLSLPVVTARWTGATWDVSRLGWAAAYLEGRSLPDDPGTHESAVVAHRTFYNGQRGPFYELPSIAIGAFIYIDLNGITYTNQVYATGDISPYDLGILVNDDNSHNRLVLLTCDTYRGGQYTQRFFAKAVQKYP